MKKHKKQFKSRIKQSEAATFPFDRHLANLSGRMTLKDIYGDSWDLVSNKNGLGRDFKQRVDDRVYPNITYAGKNPQNHCEYELVKIL